MTTPANVSRRSFLGKSPVVAAAIASVAVAAVPVAVSAGLIDVAKVRAALPRLFSGTWEEIIGELLQNAQRAGAKHVYVAMPDSGVVRELTFADDGRGILGGAAGFQKLLAIGVSGWDDQVMQDQSPLGLGLHALLANESVLEVEIISGGLAIQIDRSRWWSDESYYGNWQSLLRPASGDGFRLRVKFQWDTTLSDYTANSLKYSNNPLSYAHVAADGYADLLKIHVNGVLIGGQLGWLQDATDTVEFMYKGCQVRIGAQSQRGCTSVVMQTLINWYGQLVSAQNFVFGSSSNPLMLEIIVRAGSPFTLQSPSRKGPVENAEWRAFCAAVESKCRDLVTAKQPPVLSLLTAVLANYPQLQSVSKWLPASDYNHVTFSRVVAYASLRDAYVFPSNVVTAFEGWPAGLSKPAAHDPVRQRALLGEIENAGHRVVLVSNAVDWSRLSQCSLQLGLSRPHEADERLPTKLKFYAAATVSVLNPVKKILTVVHVAAPLAVVVEMSSYDIDQVEGVIVAPSVIEGLQDVGGEFFSETTDYDGDSSEQQQAYYDMSVSVLLAALQGHTDTMTADTELPSVFKALRDLPGAVFRPVWDNHSVSAIEIVQDGVVVRTIVVVY